MAIIVFDVNETLLDLAALDEAFADLAGERGGDVKRQWFTSLLHLSLVVSTVGTWQDFGVLARAALAGVLRRCGIDAGEAEVEAVVATMRQLPPHPEVRAAIERLRSEGHRTLALTNSAQAMADAQLGFAGLDDVLEEILSVEPTLRYKPAPEPYRQVEELLGVEPSEVVMVAAHDWDCAGAMKVGWRSGFVRRGAVYSPVLQPPTWQGEGLDAVVSAMLPDL